MNRTLIRHGELVAMALTLVGLLLPVAPSALAAQPPPVVSRADVSVFHGAVDFRPVVSHRGGAVTVSGGGQTFKLTFEAGESMSIGSFDPEGNPLPDGVYTWELELAPDARTAKALRVAASENGGIAPESWKPQSGSFTISYGLIVSPEDIEAQPQRIEAGSGLSGLPSDLASQSGLSRSFVASQDSDRAVEGGVLEQDVRKLMAATPEAAPTVSFGRGLAEDADGAAVNAGGTLERTINESAGPSLRSLVIQQVKPADGTSGRKPGSTPNK